MTVRPSRRLVAREGEGTVPVAVGANQGRNLEGRGLPLWKRTHDCDVQTVSLSAARMVAILSSFQLSSICISDHHTSY